MSGKECGCGGKVKIVYACSGGSDIGNIADASARLLSREGCAKMSCMSGVGAGLSGYVASAAGADRVLVIDGCPTDCGKKVMEKAGVSKFAHLRLTDLGFEKGKSPATVENIGKACEAAKKLL